MDHAHWMQLAIAEAHRAGAEGNTPVAAVIVRDGRVIGSGRNRVGTTQNPLDHAETVAIAAACAALSSATLAGCTLYSTMEPCPMCAWAIHLSGLSEVVLGARHRALGRTDMGAYSFEALMQLTGQSVTFTTGVLEDECTAFRREWSLRTGRQM